MSRQIPAETLQAIQDHFHAVILGRAADLLSEQEAMLPQLMPLLAEDDAVGWFPIDRMAGGFGYWLEGEGEDAKLICESWSRTVMGSGERHEITAAGSLMVAVGFV